MRLRATPAPVATRSDNEPDNGAQRIKEEAQHMGKGSSGKGSSSKGSSKGVSDARLKQKSGSSNSFGGYTKVNKGGGAFTMKPSGK